MTHNTHKYIFTYIYINVCLKMLGITDCCTFCNQQQLLLTDQIILCT